MNFIFYSSVSAQDNTKQIISLLDSIKNSYNGLTDFTFNYQMKAPIETKHDAEMTTYKMEKEKNCDAECLCHSYISYKGTDKPYMELFYLYNLKPVDFRINKDTLFLEKEGHDDLKPMSMSNPDPYNLRKIKKWLEELSSYCAEVPEKK